MMTYLLRNQKLLTKIIVMIAVKLGAEILDQDLKIDLSRKVIVAVDEIGHRALMEIEDTSITSIEEDLVTLHLLEILMTEEVEIVEIAEGTREDNLLENTKNIADITEIIDPIADHLLNLLTLEIENLKENQRDREAETETMTDKKTNFLFNLGVYMKELLRSQWILDSSLLSSIPKHDIKRRVLFM